MTPLQENKLMKVLKLFKGQGKKAKKQKKDKKLGLKVRDMVQSINGFTIRFKQVEKI